MNNKKVGVVFLILSVLVAVVMVQLIGKLTTQAEELGCFDNQECGRVESSLGIAHLGFGVIGFIFALGFYLILFAKGEEAILQRIEATEVQRSEKEKFDLILKGLDNFEKKAMIAAKEQPGITQNTLRIRTDMSKAKLSYVLGDLEVKGLIKRLKKGRTQAVFLR